MWKMHSLFKGENIFHQTKANAEECESNKQTHLQTHDDIEEALR